MSSVPYFGARLNLAKINVAKVQLECRLANLRTYEKCLADMSGLDLPSQELLIECIRVVLDTVKEASAEIETAIQACEQARKASIEAC